MFFVREGSIDVINYSLLILKNLELLLSIGICKVIFVMLSSLGNTTLFVIIKHAVSYIPNIIRGFGAYKSGLIDSITTCKYLFIRQYHTVSNCRIGKHSCFLYLG